MQQRNQTEHLPMTSEGDFEGNSLNDKKPRWIVKWITIIVATTSVLVFALTILSLQTLEKQKKYEGKLLPYLPIYSGQIQYCRLPEQYWQHRLQLIKAMGLNSVSVYVMWNFHQIERGVFDFSTGNKNLGKFLALTKKYGLNVLFRPGPYVCAEWDFGGIPARLLGIEGLVIRSPNELYESEVRLYFEALAPIIKPYLSNNGGNIILLQIENEYGYIGQNNEHMLNLVNMWKELGVQCELYIEDPGAFWQKSYWQGAHIGLSQTSSLLRYVDIELSPLRDKDSLIFGGQIYSGWFTEWGFDWGTVSKEDISKKVSQLIEKDRSFSLYMTFGGTNFGVTAGANGWNGWYNYLPHITSYDYNSPITQQGRVTDKYLALRQIFKNHHGEHYKMMDIPKPKATITINEFTPTIQGYLWENLPEPILVNSSFTYFQSKQLQMFHQGISIYQTFLPKKKYYIFVVSIHDFGLVFLDDSFVKQILRRKEEFFEIKVSCEKEQGCFLRILVQAMGHKNFGKDQRTDRKGLVDFAEVGYSSSFLWNIYKIPVFDRNYSNWKTSSAKINFPLLFKAELTLDEVGDTFFDMKNYKKGYTYVNGHLLGRYWNIGPQERLFCPGVWLKKGVNQVMILELLQNEAKPIRGLETLKDQN